MRSSDPEIQAAIDDAYQMGMAQHADEIVPFAEAVAKELKPQVILEIGSHKGGTALLWLRLVQPGGGVYSIDLPNGPWGGIDHAQATARNAILCGLGNAQGKNFAGFMGNSRSDDAYRFAHGAADCYHRLFDMVFIDGDHSYEGVRADFNLAVPLVREGGWIVLHDIIEGPIHDRDKVEVSKLWQQLKALHRGHLGINDKPILREFVGADGHWGGIGVVVA